jgi:diguanylate cyclase (GGDEF)-like protein
MRAMMEQGLGCNAGMDAVEMAGRLEGGKVPVTDPVLEQRVRDLEGQVHSQGREIRALEKIETLQDRHRELEAENRTLREQVAELHTFLNLSKTLSATLNLEELFRLALHLIGRALHVDAYALLLLDETGEQLVLKAACGLPEEAAAGRPLRRGEGISGLVAQTGQAMLVPDVRAEPRFLPQEAGRAGAGAFLCVPLRSPGRAVLGVLTAQKPEPYGFRLGDLDLFQAVGNQVAAALENAQLYQRTKELSTRDDLTGLFNRRHFFDHLEKEVQRARRYRRTFALLLLDLDDFKGYNDTHGHLQGDAALTEVARLLLASTRRADVVARFGGEEFVVLLPELSPPGAAVVAEKIRAALAAAPFASGGRPPAGRLTGTLGLATYPQDAEAGLDLLDRADRALYLGKQQGGNRVCLATPPGPP